MHYCTCTAAVQTLRDFTGIFLSPNVSQQMPNGQDVRFQRFHGSYFDVLYSICKVQLQRVIRINNSTPNYLALNLQQAVTESKKNRGSIPNDSVTANCSENPTSCHPEKNWLP